MGRPVWLKLPEVSSYEYNILSNMMFFFPQIKLWTLRSVACDCCIQIYNGFPTSLWRMDKIEYEWFRWISADFPQWCVSISTQSTATWFEGLHKTCSNEVESIAKICNHNVLFELVALGLFPSKEEIKIKTNRGINPLQVQGVHNHGCFTMLYGRV